LGSIGRSIQLQNYQKWVWWILTSHRGDLSSNGSLPELFHNNERIHVSSTKDSAVAVLHTILEGLSGDWALFLDVHGELAPHALDTLASYLDGQPDTDLIYFDQDELDPGSGRRSKPWFRPGWSPEALLSQDVLYPCLIRRDLLQEITGLEIPWDDNGLWSLHLHAAQRARRIVHIPQVLYHRYRREDQQKAGFSDDDADMTGELVDHPPARFLERLVRKNVKSVRRKSGRVQLHWDPGERLVSVVIPTHDNLPYLRRCLRTLREHTRYKPYEIVLVDTDTRDRQTSDFYSKWERQGRVRCLRMQAPFNYSAANNMGASQARGDVLLFLNDDVEALEAGWIEEMVRWALREPIGAVGATLLFPDGLIQHAGIVLGLGGIAGHVFRGMRAGERSPFGPSDVYRDVSAVTGACMMLRREVFERVGGFDMAFQLAYGDVDLCLRLSQAGYRNMVTPFARLVHHEGVSRGRKTPRADRELAEHRFAEILEAGDPYFNPNLSPRSVMPRLSLRRPQPERLKPRRWSKDPAR
jgi:GT2 family glycosyltransferase